jgi:hypothetical protein
MYDLTISLNSRERPELLLKVLEMNRRNIAGANTCMLVNLDDDDFATMRHIKQIETLADIVSIKPREDTNGEKYNRALVEAPARWYLPSGDHTAHNTRGFDHMFVDAGDLFPDGYGVVANGWATGGHWYRCHQCISAKLAGRMGFIYPPHFPFWFVDPWIDDIAYMLGRYAYSGTEVYEYPKPPTHNLQDVHFWCDVMQFCASIVRSTVLDILADPDFQEPHWRRQMQRATIPLWETRRREQLNFIRYTFGLGPYFDPDTWSPEYTRAYTKAKRLMGLI